MQWELEHAAKLPFQVKDKRGETSLSVGPEQWNALEHLEKIASGMFKEFKNQWKWIKKTHPYPEDYNSLKHSMVCLLFILKHELTEEWERWKKGLLQNNGFVYNLPSIRPVWSLTNV